MGAAELARLKVAVGTDLSEFEAGMAKVKSESSGLGSFLTTAYAAGAAAVIGFGLVSLKAASDYQNNTVSMANNAGISEAAANRIGTAFLDTAGKTVYSGEEMMKAFGPVSGQLKMLTGHALTAAQALDVTSAAGNLAEATNADLTSTMATLSNVMLAYRQPLTEAAHDTDMLFNASRAVNLPIADFTAGILKLHARLGDVAPSFKETAALTIELAQNGVTGNRGMMVLNTGLTTLLGGSKAVGDELAKLKVHVYDAKGNFVGMESTIAQLSPKLAKMSEHQRRLAEATLFGTGAEGIMNDIMKRGVTGYDAATAAVDKHGTAQTAAELQAKTFNGTVRTFQASLKDVTVTFGQKLLPVATQVMTFFATNAVPVMTSIGDHMNVILPILGLLTGAFLLWKVTMMAMGIASFIGGIVEMGAAFLVTAGEEGVLNAIMAMNPIGLIIIGVALLIAGLYLLVTHFKEVVAWVTNAWNWLGNFKLIIMVALGPIGLFIGLIVLIVSHFKEIVDWVQQAASWVGKMLDILSNSPGPIGTIASSLKMLLGVVGDVVGAVSTAVGWFGKLFDAHSKAVNLKPVSMVGENAPAPGNTSTATVTHSNALGLDYVPYDNYLTYLHKGERVQTAQQVAQQSSAPMGLGDVSALLQECAEHLAAIRYNRQTLSVSLAARRVGR